MIVGTGALTIPKAFSEAGWLFSSITIVFLAFVSFITGTFMFESMAIANSLKRNKDDLKVKFTNLYRTYLKLYFFKGLFRE